MNVKLNIAIDGPAGAGKSTVAKLIADKLKLLYIDSGSMYRAVTLYALRNNYNFNDIDALAKLSSDVKIELLSDENVKFRILLNGEDVTEEIREPEVSRHVSLVAKIPAVRENMVRQQKKIAACGGVVMDGRDIGNRVMPDANYKFFLTASIEERAKRRCQDLVKQGYEVPLEKIITEIAQRDEIDKNRPVDPLVPARDAVIIDSTGLTVQQVVDTIIGYIK